MQESSEPINVPESAAEINVHWLKYVLRAEPAADYITSIELDKNFGPISLLGKTVRVMIHYTNERSGPTSVIVKFQLHCDKPKREGEIYRLLSEAQVPFIPRVYGTFGNGNLVLEDLSSTHFIVKEGAELTLHQIQNTVSVIAELTSSFWNDPRIPKEDPSHYINSININMAESWDHFEQRYRSRLEQHITDFEWMHKNTDAIAQFYNSGTPTMTHGDVHKENLLFPNDGSDKPIFIDWQLSGQKVLPFDLSFFFVKQLTIEQRRTYEDTLLHEYHRSLPDHIRESYSFDRLYLEYRACVLRSMLSAVMSVGPRFSNRPDQFERADRLAARVIAAIQDLKPVEAIRELQDRGFLKAASPGRRNDTEN